MISLLWSCSTPPAPSPEPAVAPVLDTAPPNTDLDGGLAPLPPRPQRVRHACAVTDTGEVWCWGAGGAGQLGRGRFTELRAQLKSEALSVYQYARHSDGSSAAEAPARVALTAKATAVATGRAHTCALSVQGEVYCWGRNLEGQVGPRQQLPRTDARTWSGDVPSPVQQPLPEPARAFVAGGDSSCAIGVSQTAWCWGNGSHDPVVVGRDVRDLWVRYDRRCVLHEDGRIACVGRGLPERVDVPGAVQVVVRGEDVCTRTEEGSVHCAQELRLPGPARALAAGESFLCARVSEDIFCWGGNASGQIQPRGPASFSAPVLVRSGVRALGVGEDALCLSNAEEVRCQGYDLSGQLGSGGRIPLPGVLSLAVSM